jgi:hypothetical protein
LRRGAQASCGDGEAYRVRQFFSRSLPPYDAPNRSSTELHSPYFAPFRTSIYRRGYSLLIRGEESIETFFTR